MTMPSAPEQLEDEVELRPDDLVVRSLTVQGGEAEIGGEQTAFARIVLTGVELRYSGPNGGGPTRRDTAVLKLDHAATFAADLGGVMDNMVRSTRTPTVRSAGTWSWMGAPPHADDILVVEATANRTALPFASGTRPTVRVDFTGTLVHALAWSDPPVHVRRAVFSSPRQVQALTSSLKKVVLSALAQRRLDVYVAGDEPLTAYGF